MWKWLKNVAIWAARRLEESFTLLPGKWLALIAVVVLAPLAATLFVLVRFVPQPSVEGENFLKTDTALGWYGVALGVFGFWYTASQLYLTKRESESAKQAADDANRKAEETIRKLATRASTDAYGRLIDWALYFLKEAVDLEDTKQWAVASRRVRDTARQLREIQSEGKHADERWAEAARSLDDFASVLAHHRHDAEERPRAFRITKWRELTAQLQDALRQELTGPTQPSRATNDDHS